MSSQRTCIVTRQQEDPENLLRFVLSPDNEVVADIKRKLPGRGVWVLNSRDMVEKAVSKGLFARGFKSQCRVPDDLAAKVDELLASACLGYLALANKAGQAIRGFDKVANALSKGQIEVLIAASDGSEGGIGKLKGLLRAGGASAKQINLFSSAQLGLALGGTNVIHAAITTGGLAGKFVGAAEKLSRYRDTE